MHYYTIDCEIYDPIKKDKFFWREYKLKTEFIINYIFDNLNDNNIKITCFVTNDFIENFYELFNEKIKPFHEISCHTDTHFYFKKENKKEFIKSIQNNKEFIEFETEKNALVSDHLVLFYLKI